MTSKMVHGNFLVTEWRAGEPPVISCFHHPVDKDPSLENLADLSLGWWAIRSRRSPAPGSSLTALAFPVQPAGRHPHLMFRSLFKLHASYGLRICSSSLRGLCHEAPAQPVARLDRSLATQSYRYLLRWDFHPLVRCTIQAHGCSRNGLLPAPH